MTDVSGRGGKMAVVVVLGGGWGSLVLGKWATGVCPRCGQKTETRTSTSVAKWLFCPFPQQFRKTIHNPQYCDSEWERAPPFNIYPYFFLSLLVFLPLLFTVNISTTLKASKNPVKRFNTRTFPAVIVQPAVCNRINV